MTGEKRAPTTPADRNDVLRALVRALQRDEFDGNLSAVGRALGLKSPATLADFLSGSKGAGLKLIEGLSAYLGRTPNDLYASGGDLAALRAKPPPAPPVRVRFGDLPEWDEPLAKAKALSPTIPPDYWRKLADVDVWIDGPVTAGMVAEMAEFLLRHR